MLPAGIPVDPRTGVEDFKRFTSAKVADLRCPDHHQPPRLHFRGMTLRDVTVQMTACCDKLIRLANQKIAGA